MKYVVWLMISVTKGTSALRKTEIEFFWPDMSKSITDYVVTCLACQKKSESRYKRHGTN